MKKIIISLVGVVVWLALVNVLISFGDELINSDAIVSSKENPDSSTERLTPRNSILSIRMRGD